MKYNHIIFDIDGTMLDSSYADLMALQRVLHETVHKDFATADLQFGLGLSSEVVLKQFGVEDVEAANLLWGEYMQEQAHTLRLFDGIREVLAELSGRGVKLGIITSKNRTEYKNDFIPFGIHSYFDTVINVEDSSAPKPSSEPMLAYLKKSGAAPHEVLYIGDTLYDSQCAQGAGVEFGLGLWGCHSSQPISASYYFNTPEEILNLIE